MSARVPDHIVQQVAGSVNLVKLIGRHCDLKPKGRSYWACCPFHKEKTPSFKVDPDKGVFYCFGCHEGGNAFTFLQKVEGLSFREALEQLARDAHVDLSPFRAAGGPSTGEFERLRGACALAAAYYEKCLEKSEAARHAREYLRGRQISEVSVARWHLGYAPDGWENFLKFSLGRGRAERELESAGLVKRRDQGGGCYDAFRNRLMFPIGDRAGAVIGFGARALSDEDQPKYLNSAEGPLFHKGRCFYGLPEAREAVRAERCAAIVEGYTDVIMAHQHGVENVMAVLGTALTEDHARALGRMCEKVILVFDADEAGRRSAVRSIEALLSEELDVRVAGLEGGLDPCEFLLARGAEAFRQRLAESEDFLDFRVRCAREAHDTETVAGRARAVNEVAGLALCIGDRMRQDMLIRRVAEEFGIRADSLYDRVRGLSSQRGRSGSVGSGPKQGGAVARNGEQQIDFELVGLILGAPQLQALAKRDLDVEGFQDCGEAGLLRMMVGACPNGGPFEAIAFMNALGDAELASLAAEALAAEEERLSLPKCRTPEERYSVYVQYYCNKRRRREIEGLLSTTATTPSPPDEDAVLEAYAKKRLQEDREHPFNPREDVR
ncbi:MAG: DNA primase [Candidatus Brocadiia bacterium]|nr:DNA primase [Candidatus Brocadiia bacterium]